MRGINITTNTKTYKICIGENIFSDAIDSFIIEQNPDKIVLVMDENLFDVLKEHDLLKKHQYIKIRCTEKNKNIKTIIKILHFFYLQNISRKSLVINIGGGVLTDVAAFACSIYQRGVRYINIPTTLLSMVDASFGGKTGINYKNIKNLIGSFYHPDIVIVDTNFLKTLPKRYFIGAYGEIIKHALIYDTNYLDYLMNKNHDLVELIEKSILIKKSVVGDDEFETKGTRKILNFGHTIGHAIESYSQKVKKTLYHGYAVAKGIVAESWISYKQGLLTEQESEKIINLINKYNLNKKLKFKIDAEEIITMMMKDKKNSNNEIKFVLLERIGKAIPDQTVPKNLIIESLNLL
ncbi:MAG: 3-dehydroquinate synthase [Candidatus Dojkabacteria bacterium]|nr:3-dehydroquinate synthase [Candidatus Dojkabacteria bacterium]